jgi:hypothetical protein
MSAAAAERFVRTYLDKDWSGIRSMVSDNIRVRALLPRYIQEVSGPDLAVGLMDSWLEPEDEVVEIEDLDVVTLPSAVRVSVRYLGRSGGAEDLYRIEHHMLLDIEDDKVNRLDFMCSGWQPTAETG